MYRPAGLCLGEILPFTEREALLIRVLYRIIDIIQILSDTRLFKFFKKNKSVR